MEPQKQIEGLTKIQTTQQFEKLFQNQPNTNCFQCGKKSKQWAETKHGVFLCLSCAAIFREVMKVVNVKSIGLDLWYPEEISLLKVGGNAKFSQFLAKYQLTGSDPKIALRSTAANYYRKSLIAQAAGKPLNEPAPTLEQGKKPYVAQIPLTQMTTQQIVEQARLRISYVGEKTKQYGTKAFDKVHHKVTSGELKEDAKKAAQTVSKKAKDFWSFLSTKIDQIKSSKDEKPKEATQL